MPNILKSIRIPNIIQNNWNKIINTILIITTSILWVKTRNTEQHINNLSLQLARQPLDSICYTPNYPTLPIYQSTPTTVQVNETNLIFNLYNTCTTSISRFLTPIVSYAKLNRIISNNTATNNTEDTILEEEQNPLDPCSSKYINDENTLHTCMAIANTSTHRNNILHYFHNNIGISNLSPETQRAFAVQIAETNNPSLTRSLTDQNAKDIARDQICKFACKTAIKTFGL